MVCFEAEIGHVLDIEYSGNGHQMARSFYIPTLKLSKRYDRVSGYFSVGSCARARKNQPYTRREYIDGIPGSKVVKFTMGSPGKEFNTTIRLISLKARAPFFS